LGIELLLSRIKARSRLIAEIEVRVLALEIVMILLKKTIHEVAELLEKMLLYQEKAQAQAGDKIKKADQRITSLETFVQDIVNLGVDVHFKTPHMILIYTRLGGGQIREIEAQFEDLKALDEFVRELRTRFRTNNVTVDMPFGLRGMWQ
jgi:hypothetical protein